MGATVPVRLRLRELRMAKGLTQVELAERSGLQQSLISYLEAGKAQGVKFDTLERLARALGVDAALLIEYTPERGRGRG
jgi:transcriptional regulator with XRE-family HTH domain